MKQLRTLFLLILLFSAVLSSYAQKQSRLPTYVLVHGAWHGGWCWQFVAQRLTDAHNIVYTPTLTGLGERKHLIDPSVDIDTHIQDIINLIEMEDLHDVYLVGHSYAGAVIAGVADRIPSRLHKLIFLDAMIIEDGQSPISLQPKAVQEVQLKNIQRKENFAPFDVALFGVTAPNMVSWVKDRLSPQPFGTFAQQLCLKNPYGNGLPLVYIACTDPQLPIMKEMSKKVQSDHKFNWHYREIATGHDAMLTEPKKLADMLMTLVD
ncbi:alpha/beta fold hydrolase [uncultured Sphingobacterium sp.]|jgi:pimeloyl-ACP methyl ester carboxylesterase|uniref:alpha/beta hydrolase n=1 Tax=uncultured Sphingobacterium sp. TaxID=182688 RepID=UPI0037492211